MRRLIVVVAALLLSPALGVAQDSTATDTVPDAPSLKEIRQRTGFALSRVENLRDEIDAAISHILRLRAMSDSAVARDSVLALTPDPVDTVRITETDTVVDTVEVGASDSLPPAVPARPIEFTRLDSTSVQVSWGEASGARWYHFGSSAGAGWTETPSDTLDLQDGAWICLWAANGAGRTPDGSGVCASYSEPADTTATDTVADYQLTVGGQEVHVTPDSAQAQVGDSLQLAAAQLLRSGDSIVGCVGYCTPYVDSIRPVLWRDSVGYWLGVPEDPDAPSHIWGLHPMSVLDSIIAQRSAT